MATIIIMILTRTLFLSAMRKKFFRSKKNNNNNSNTEKREEVIQRAVWQPDSSATSCFRCTQYFTFFRRRVCNGYSDYSSIL